MVLPIGQVEIADSLQRILSETAIDDGAKAITAQLGVHSVPPADPYLWTYSCGSGRICFSPEPVKTSVFST